MDIYHLLPLLDGWKWIKREIDGFLSPTFVDPGTTFRPVPLVRGKGWILSLLVLTDSPHLRFAIHYDGIKIDFSSQELHLTQQIQPRNFGMWLSVYNTISIPNMFGMSLTPSPPLPFRTDLEMFLTNPPARLDGTPNVRARVFACVLFTVEIVNESLFRESMGAVVR